MEYVTHVFLLLGGIALFLYGISFMSKSLEEAAGSNLRVILEKMTSKGALAFVAGAFATALIQSSGACGVMVVGFVDAQPMNLTQAMYVMLGANIGTTITAQIIAFKIETIAPLILFVGMILYMFVRNKNVRKIGGVVLGFGLLFVGIFLMGEATGKLNLGTLIENFLNNYSNPLLLVLFGVVFTAIIQSSSASIGILQVLVASSAAVANIDIGTLMYLILGMNIGACSPIVIASLSGSKTSRRAGFANMVLKVFGVIIFIVVMLVFPGINKFIVKLSPNDLSRQIANMHLFFNLISSLLLCPFVPLLSKLLMKIIPDKEEDDMVSQKLLYITPEVVLTPSLAVTQAKKEIIRMADLANDNLSRAIDMFFGKQPVDMDAVENVEKTINFLNHELNGYLVKLHAQHLTDKELEKVGMMFRVLSDVERIGDHAENITEYAQIALDHHVQFSEDASAELAEMAKASLAVCVASKEIYDAEQFERLDKISAMEEEVDDYQTNLTEHHIARLKANLCNPRGGVMFTDMVTDLERCADHAINIAFAINGEKPVEVKKAFIITRGTNMD